MRVNDFLWIMNNHNGVNPKTVCFLSLCYCRASRENTYHYRDCDEIDASVNYNTLANLGHGIPIVIFYLRCKPHGPHGCLVFLVVDKPWVAQQ